MNPHAPSDDWIEAVATDDGYGADAEPGDVGTTEVTRRGKRFEITVECLTDEAAVAVCRDCGAELGTQHDIGAELACTECDGIMDVKHRRPEA